MSKYIITFVGVPGTSKTPVAYYLSWNLGLPVLNNDSMRTESTEDAGEWDVEAYEALRDSRLKQIISLNKPFIYDASVDRSWKFAEQKLEGTGYGHFIINMELSRPFVENLYKAKGYTQSDHLDQWFQDHNDFLRDYSDVPSLTITDKDFPRRLEIALEAVRKWLSQQT